MKTGPIIMVKKSCSGCVYELSESYACQGDSGHDVFCNHPIAGKQYVGDSVWRTPEWCPEDNADEIKEGVKFGAEPMVDPVACGTMPEPVAWMFERRLGNGGYIREVSTSEHRMLDLCEDGLREKDKVFELYSHADMERVCRERDAAVDAKTGAEITNTILQSELTAANERIKELESTATTLDKELRNWKTSAIQSRQRILQLTKALGVAKDALGDIAEKSTNSDWKNGLARQTLVKIDEITKGGD
jgi:hypothetical protein